MGSKTQSDLLMSCLKVRPSTSRKNVNGRITVQKKGSTSSLSSLRYRTGGGLEGVDENSDCLPKSRYPTRQRRLFGRTRRGCKTTSYNLFNRVL